MFSPLGNFKSDAPRSAQIVAYAKEFYATLPSIPAGLLNRLYLHWTVAGCSAEFTDYNVEAEYVTGSHVLKITHDPKDNARGYNDNEPASHTWHRNTGALGIAITGMDGATEQDFGPDAVTLAGLEYLCAGAAALCLKYGIDSNGKVSEGSTHLDNNGNSVNTLGEWNLLTHGEAAVIDSYSSERWDLGTFVPLPAGVALTSEMRTVCGSALRDRIHAYKVAMAA